MVTPQLVYDIINEEVPFSRQENWDNSGLLINTGKKSEKVLVCLVVTEDVILKAEEAGAKIIVSHHPVIFTPVKSVDSGDIVFKRIEKGISIISAHTNFDKYRYGTCYKMAELLGLEILSRDFDIGILAGCRPVNIKDFAQRCKDAFGRRSFTQAGKYVNKVFICAGSGSGMKNEVIASGADCFLTGECKYHDMLDLKNIGISTVAVGHDLSEMVSVETLAKILREKIKEENIILYLAESLTENI